MNIGGLAARAAMLKNQKPTIPCKRCGLNYVAEEHDKCPHCGLLSEFELSCLLERLEQERLSRSQLGFWFGITALIVAFLMIVVSID